MPNLKFKTLMDSNVPLYVHSYALPVVYVLPGVHHSLAFPYFMLLQQFFFETGAMPTPTELQNSTLCG